MNLFNMLERTAERGAEGLSAEARAELARAVSALQQPGGGFAGLDGRADPYFSFFAWLSLRALGVPYDRAGLCCYMRERLHAASPVDAQCAQVLLAVEGRATRFAWVGLVPALLHSDSRGYGAFLLMMAARGAAPRWVARLAWCRLRRSFSAGAAGHLPTPQLAAGAVLASLAGDCDAGLLKVLQSRRCASGGFASAPGAQADLLATAVAGFALCVARAVAGPEGALAPAGQSGPPEALDLAFVELCWREDGLFGATPPADSGDAEHTFYGLLALGTFR